MKATLADARLALVQRVVKAEVARCLSDLFKHGPGFKPHRSCANCAASFHPRHRWHFLCSSECRRAWNRGLFKPHPERRRRRRAA